MAYTITYKMWLPYARTTDPRGFISKQFGNGHSGVDSVNNDPGNTVCAVLNGYVLRTTVSPTLGNVVEYGAGNIRIALYHLAQVHVAVGDEVKAGETVLGTEGSTGSLATGKHLHTSLWINNVLTDPESYLSGQKKWKEAEGAMRVMQFQVGARVHAIGKLAPSAYSAVGTVTRGDVLQVDRIYENTAFPYAVASNGVIVGFAKENELVLAEENDTAAELERVKAELAAANAKLDAVRKAVAE